MSDIPRRLGGPAESRLDRAIDRAVREMVQVDARPGFRGRVFARLDPNRVRSSSVFFRLAVATCALAVFVLAVRVVRDGSPAVEVRRVQSVADHRVGPERQPATPPRATTPGTAPTVHAHRGGDRPPHRLTREPIPMPRVTDVFGNRGTAVGAASLDADDVWPAPTTEPHEDGRGTVAPLRIPALEPPAPIVVAPLNPRGPGL